MPKNPKLHLGVLLLVGISLLSCKDSLWGKYDNPVDEQASDQTNPTDPTNPTNPTVSSLNLPSSVYCTVHKSFQFGTTQGSNSASLPSGLTWTTSDPSIVTVSSTGLVSGIALGTAIVTATTSDGLQKSYCTVTVDNFPFTGSDITVSSTGTQNSGFWVSGFAMSVNGQYFAGYSSNGNIGYSSDSGATWIPRPLSGSRSWSGIAISDDGSKIFAYVNQGNIFHSLDSGLTWVTDTSAGSRSWAAIKISLNGSKIVACPSGDYIMISSDSGTSWAPAIGAGNRSWCSLSMSYDGTKILAGDYNNLYYTSDGGSTWNAVAYPNGITSWTSGLISGNGTTLFGCSDKTVYRSTDAGATWVAGQAITGSTAPVFRLGACSQDGSRLIMDYDQSFTLSTDSGSTWSSYSRANVYYSGAPAISADGKTIVFINNSTKYTYNGD